MAKCEICDKGVVFGGQYSHSHRRSNRKWTPNLRKIKAVINNSKKTINIDINLVKKTFFISIISTYKNLLCEYYHFLATY